ncbi:hypothetical protein AUP68_11304 [Ilyonectria robusta]
MIDGPSKAKARNPDLKIVIALDGWAFSDPGPWQDISPSLDLKKENRATLINNLLGFISQYGYGGVALTTATAQTGMPRPTRKELREAINASGRDYIVTFTAPSSDWYLRHFDLKGIEAHVDWVNLMSYDLHGVPGQRQPYHKATIVAYQLDRNRLRFEPSKCHWNTRHLSGTLTDTRALCSSGALALSLKTWYSAWASMADPLSSNLLRVGSPGSPAAASRALANPVATLTRLKFSLMPIDDASNIGLHGLIIWAIDLDTRSIEALRAIPKGEHIGGTKASVSLVNLERFLPAEMLPPEDAETNYGLIHFSSNANTGEINPNQTGFSFVLVTGDSHSVSSLNKHEDEPEPLVFFDCPPYVFDQPRHEIQTTRVVCLSEDVEAASGSWTKC